MALDIARVFAMKLAALRRQLRPNEMAAAIQALRQEKEAALRALKERRVTERHANRALRRKRSPARACP
jgi:hypothetical protein